MKTKHTQGEWRLVQETSVFSGDRLICVTSKFSDTNETLETNKANAKLIASAPKLLQGLIDLKSQLIDGGFSETSVTVSGIDVLIKEATK